MKTAVSLSTGSRQHHGDSYPVMKHYTLTERLGAGTYATVYKGHRKVDICGCLWYCSFVASS